MEREQYLLKLLADEGDSGQGQASISFLKKLIILSRFGELRINGQAPNRAFNLSEYLLDERRMMIDWSRLDQSHRRALIQWLVLAYEAQFRPCLSSTYDIDESRGLPEEKPLGFWQWLRSLYPFNRLRCLPVKTEFFRDQYQIKQVDMQLSSSGMLVDLVSRFHVLPQQKLRPTDEYQDQDGGSNVKRLILTNSMVDQVLEHSDELSTLGDYLEEPHPHAIDVSCPELRERRMKDFRQNKQYVYKPIFLWRLVIYLKNWFAGWLEPEKVAMPALEYRTLYSDDDIIVKTVRETESLRQAYKKRPETMSKGLVHVFEKRPQVDTFVFSGGGAKIFGHLGAVDELKAHGIRAKNFVGSSAGAIMAMLLYLGYTTEEIKENFDMMREQILIQYKIDITGLSTTERLKKALVYLVREKLRQIIAQYSEDFESVEAKAYLEKYIYPPGPITFRCLSLLKKFCPRAPIGDNLIVTATDAKRRKTDYFSTQKTPDMEIAEAVKISGSLPFLYKPTIIGDKQYTDGGVLNNLPLSACERVNDTLLEHELGADIRVLAFQFNNGYEKDVLYSAQDVYREGWLKNTFYSLVTGVADPASAWVKERQLLRKYAPQSIIIDTGGISSSKLNLEHDKRETLIESGHQAARHYLKPRLSSKTAKHKTLWAEWLKRGFENLEELFYYCAYREKWALLDKFMQAIEGDVVLSLRTKEKLLAVKNEIMKSKPPELMQSIEQDPVIASSYKAKILAAKRKIRKSKALNETTFDSIRKTVGGIVSKYRYELFGILYPSLWINWLCLKGDKDNKDSASPLDIFVEKFDALKDKVKPENTYSILQELSAFLTPLTGSSHLIIYIYRSLILSLSEASITEVREIMRSLVTIMCNPEWLKHFSHSELFKTWSLSNLECCKVVALLYTGDIKGAKSFLTQHDIQKDSAEVSIATSEHLQPFTP